MRDLISLVEKYNKFYPANPDDVDVDSHGLNPEINPLADNPHSFVHEKRRGAGLIGPHEYREMNLMLAGKKPCAMPSINSANKDIWMKAAKENGWTVRRVKFAVGAMGYLFALPGEEYRLDQIQRVYDRVRATGRMTDADHIRMGLLLGYSKAAIMKFLGNPKRRRY